MFMGTTHNSIDEKNRVIVPARLRAELGNRCVLTKGLDACLNIYTMADWDRQMEKITRLPESDPKVRAFIRHFCGNAAECELDKQGRIVIPKDLIQYADIEREIVIVGCYNYAEIWAEESYRKLKEEENLEEMIKDLESLGL